MSYIYSTSINLIKNECKNTKRSKITTSFCILHRAIYINITCYKQLNSDFIKNNYIKEKKDGKR